MTLWLKNVVQYKMLIYLQLACLLLKIFNKSCEKIWKCGKNALSLHSQIRKNGRLTI